MSEYIDKDQILKFKQDVYDADGHLLYAIPTGCVIAMKSADVAPVRHGRWENGKCTGCGFDPSWLLEDGESFLAQWVWDEGLDFCPNCGAKMYEEYNNA